MYYGKHKKRPLFFELHVEVLSFFNPFCLSDCNSLFPGCIEPIEIAKRAKNLVFLFTPHFSHRHTQAISLFLLQTSVYLPLFYLVLFQIEHNKQHMHTITHTHTRTLVHVQHHSHCKFTPLCQATMFFFLFSFTAFPLPIAFCVYHPLCFQPLFRKCVISFYFVLLCANNK